LRSCLFPLSGRGRYERLAGGGRDSGSAPLQASIAARVREQTAARNATPAPREARTVVLMPFFASSQFPNKHLNATDPAGDRHGDAGHSRHALRRECAT
jgi:hypothetical protein